MPNPPAHLPHDLAPAEKVRVSVRARVRARRQDSIVTPAIERFVRVRARAKVRVRASASVRVKVSVRVRVGIRVRLPRTSQRASPRPRNAGTKRGSTRRAALNSP